MEALASKAVMNKPGPGGQQGQALLDSRWSQPCPGETGGDGLPRHLASGALRIKRVCRRLLFRTGRSRNDLHTLSPPPVSFYFLLDFAGPGDHTDRWCQCDSQAREPMAIFEVASDQLREISET